MKITESELQSLRDWASAQMPQLWGKPRKARLEIDFDLEAIAKRYSVYCPTARAYLARPQCYGHCPNHDVFCECGPIAEMRLP